MTSTDRTAPGLAHDYLGLDGLLSAGELALRDRVRDFVAERIRPNIAAWYEAAHFPRELVPEMGALGLLGTHLTRLRLPRPQRRRVRPGRAGTGGGRFRAADLRQRAGVAGMSAIHKFGSEEHKERWLPDGRRRADRLFRADRTGSRQRPGAA